MKKTIFALAFSSLLIIACKKDHNELQDITPTVQTLSGSYKMAKITARVSGGPEQDITNNYLSACQKDDVHKLNSNLTYDYMDAGTVCSSDGSYSGVWSLPSSTSIIIDGETASILKFNGSNLNISYDLGSGNALLYYLIKQ